MLKSKLIYLLKTFSKDEFKRFGQFIHSPFFNSEVVLANLYEELKNYFPDFENANLDKKKIYAKLYTSKQYNDELMRNIISDMLFFAEEFLIYNAVGKKTFLKRISLLRELTDKKQQVLFNKNFKQTEALLKSSKVKDEDYYHYMNKLEDERTWNLQSSTSKVNIKQDNFNKSADSLLHYFLIDIVKHYAIMFNQKKYIYDFKYSFNFLGETLRYIENNKTLTAHIPCLDIYYNSIMLFKTEGEKYFDKLRKSIRKNFETLKPIDRKNIYVALVNHCSEQINKGNMNFIKERFELYKELIKKNIHYEGNNFISHIFFINVVSNSLELREFQWCENFIKKFINDVFEELRDDTFHFCMAMFHFERNNFDESLVALSKVKFSDSMFKWYVNCLGLMIYYSTSSTEPFNYLIDSFRHIISNKKIFSNRRKELMGRFITVIRKLYNLKYKSNTATKYEITKLKKEIQNINYIFGKSWLMKKADELADSL